MLNVISTKKIFKFKKPSGTSRGVLTEKYAYFLKIFDADKPELFGYGEVSIISGLSIDDEDALAKEIEVLSEYINLPLEELRKKYRDFPALVFGIETALLDLQNGGIRKLFHNQFSLGKMPLKINGLIWMGDVDFMRQQIQDKLQSGFHCVKMKIGAIDFQNELNILRELRKEYDAHELEIRVDANGAFSLSEAKKNLKALEELEIHSIEQPIKQGQWDDMRNLIAEVELPIALDEELIGIHDYDKKKELLETVQPDYIILKPSLLGGFGATQEWITLAGELSIPWWITSALESNLGLSAIAQFTAGFYNPLPQGLGTGQLYTENIDSPLQLKGQFLFYDPTKDWNYKILEI